MGHFHRHCVQSYDAVKGTFWDRSNGQTVFWALSPSPLVVTRRYRDFGQSIDSQRVKGKNLPWTSGQGHFWIWSEILTTVAALDTASMGVTPFDHKMIILIDL
jgi:hypothetical protein